MEYIRNKRKYNELTPINCTDIIDKDNLAIQLSNLAITKRLKTESGIIFNTYQIPVREYINDEERNNSLDTTCETPYDADVELRIVEDYYKIKNAELFRQMFG
jgi:hypothetical protein